MTRVADAADDPRDIVVIVVEEVAGGVDDGARAAVAGEGCACALGSEWGERDMREGLTGASAVGAAEDFVEVELGGGVGGGEGEEGEGCEGEDGARHCLLWGLFGRGSEGGVLEKESCISEKRRRLLGEGNRRSS